MNGTHDNERKASIRNNAKGAARLRKSPGQAGQARIPPNAQHNKKARQRNNLPELTPRLGIPLPMPNTGAEKRNQVVDAYTWKDKIVLWVKTPKDERIEVSYKPTLYIDAKDARILHTLRQHGIKTRFTTKQDYLGNKKNVAEIKLRPDKFTKVIKDIEKHTKYQARLYNADILPEDQYLYEHKIKPFQGQFHLKTARISCSLGPIRRITINSTTFSGTEKETLENFTKEFHKQDPDVLMADRAFYLISHIQERMSIHGIKCKFHRWDETPIKYKGGRSYWSYNQVKYADHPIRLHGRFLIDTTTAISETGISGLISLAALIGTRLQQLASRTFGASYQMALVRELIEQDLLVPYKNKPLPPPIELGKLLKADRAGHTLDAPAGIHEQVAEIDFVSMYPHIIINENISAETISKQEPLKKVPGLDITISHAKQGIVPKILSPLLQARLQTQDPKLKQALKWILVTAYGYLRFREFKLGISTSHMAVGAYARETLLKARDIAEEQGFQVLHGIIDSLYIKKKGMTDKDVEELCQKIQEHTKIPIKHENTFDWIKFCTRTKDPEYPVPARYYGKTRTGMKVRGLETRRRDTPEAIKEFQQEVLNRLEKCKTAKEVEEAYEDCQKLLSKARKEITQKTNTELAITTRLSKEKYHKSKPQHDILKKLKQKALPGMSARYVKGTRAFLPDEHKMPDYKYYRKYLNRSLHSVYGKAEIWQRQLTLTEALLKN